MACINCSPSISREYGKSDEHHQQPTVNDGFENWGRQHWLGPPDLGLSLAVEVPGVIERSSDFRAHSRTRTLPRLGVGSSAAPSSSPTVRDSTATQVTFRTRARRRTHYRKSGVNNGAGMAGQPLVNLRLLNRRRLDRAALVQRDEH